MALNKLLSVILLDAVGFAGLRQIIGLRGIGGEVILIIRFLLGAVHRHLEERRALQRIRQCADLLCCGIHIEEQLDHLIVGIGFALFKGKFRSRQIGDGDDAHVLIGNGRLVGIVVGNDRHQRGDKDGDGAQDRQDFRLQFHKTAPFTCYQELPGTIHLYYKWKFAENQAFSHV